MSLNTDELDRLADDMLRGSRLTHSIYCGRCGYNLKSLTYTGHCPECGGKYNARPTRMEGIFNPQALELPITDALVVIVTGAMGYYLLSRSLAPVESGGLFFGAVVLAVWGACLYRLIVNLRRFLQFREIESRIANGEDDD